MTQAAYRLDGRAASAERFYAVACDPSRSVVIEACAGAGKTWMLVSRILRALLDGAQPHEILAITFTKKAAGEMRERLDQWLAAFSDPRAAVDALRERGLDDADAKALAPRLAQLYEQVLDAERPVEIRTFHAWFSTLLRQAPLDLLDSLGLHPDVALIEDTSELAGDLYRRFHAVVEADAGLRQDYLALVRSVGRHTLRRWLDAALDKRIEIELADAAGTLEPSVAEACEVEPAVAGCDEPAQALWRDVERLSMLRRVARDLGRQNGATARKKGGELEEALSAAPRGDARAAQSVAPAADALAALNIPADADARAAPSAGPPASARTALTAALAALLTDKGTLRQHLDAPELDAAVLWLRRLQAATLQHDARAQHQHMVRLARVLLREFAAVKRERALADMADLEQLALALLRDSASAGWVQQRLDARVRHLLIDEFQDTSPLQWQALQAWLGAYAGAGGAAPSVLIVGDPKQSIYRFRRAEPRVFAAAREFVVQGLGGSVLECDHTRRNAPAVLAVLNPVFEAAEAGGEYGGFRRHTGSVRTPLGDVFALAPAEPEAAAAMATAGRWRDSLTEPRDRAETARQQAEARGVAIAIGSLVAQGVAPGDIMVLARRRETLRQLAAELRIAQLPHAAVEAQALAESPEVSDLLALLDVLASPGHDLSLAQALKSPLFSASDDDLQALAGASRGRGGWWAALMRPVAPGAQQGGLMDGQQGGLMDGQQGGLTGGHQGGLTGGLQDGVQGGLQGPLQDGRAIAPESPALLRARTILGQLAEDARTLPPHDLLDAIVHRCDAATRIAAALPVRRRRSALGAVEALLAQALSLDGGRYTSIYGFVRSLRRRAVAVAVPAETDAVQLLTVHGAKGLEARAVVVMDADPSPRPAETATLLIDWPVQARAPRCCAFVAQESRIAPSLAPLLQAEREARDREELNSLYVAMTRAREQLVFSRTPPRRVAGVASWWTRLAVHVAERDATVAPDKPASDRPPPGAQALAPSVALLTLPTWTASAAPPAPPGRAAADPAAAALGSAVHRVLEWALGPSPSTPLATLAIEAARQNHVAPSRAGEVAAFAGAILQSAACRRFFPPAPLQWAGNEVVFVDGADVLRLDRLVALASDGRREWWVLDYKLNADPLGQAAYHEQMRRYRAVVARANPHDRVRCAFITGGGHLVEIDLGLAPLPADA